MALKLDYLNAIPELKRRHVVAELIGFAAVLAIVVVVNGIPLALGRDGRSGSWMGQLMAIFLDLYGFPINVVTSIFALLMAPVFLKMTHGKSLVPYIIASIGFPALGYLVDRLVIAEHYIR